MDWTPHIIPKDIYGIPPSPPSHEEIRASRSNLLHHNTAGLAEDWGLVDWGEWQVPGQKICNSYEFIPAAVEITCCYMCQYHHYNELLTKGMCVDV